MQEKDFLFIFWLHVLMIDLFKFTQTETRIPGFYIDEVQGVVQGLIKA